jgi:hypothetical protein
LVWPRAAVKILRIFAARATPIVEVIAGARCFRAAGADRERPTK